VKSSKNAIALLITVMFVMVITVAIGIGLKQINSAASVVKDENLMYQTSIIVEDTLTILQNSKDIQQVVETNSSSNLYLLIAEAGFIPFEINGLEIVMKISSARGKFNPAQIDVNNTQALQIYFNSYNVNSQYIDILRDSISGIKEDNSYNSTIFDKNPYLFRDYIASSEQLKKINDFYTQEYNDNSLAKINFDELFYYSKDTNMSIDLNFATTEVWQMMLGCQKERAEFLNAGGGSYETLESMDLNDDEKEFLRAFKTSFFEPILFVELEISRDDVHSKVTFEYDIKHKKGSNFVYEI
jgi:hypothetical protein